MTTATRSAPRAVPALEAGIKPRMLRSPLHPQGVSLDLVAVGLLVSSFIIVPIIAGALELSTEVLIAMFAFVPVLLVVWWFLSTWCDAERRELAQSQGLAGSHLSEPRTAATIP